MGNQKSSLAQQDFTNTTTSTRQFENDLDSNNHNDTVTTTTNIPKRSRSSFSSVVMPKAVEAVPSPRVRNKDSQQIATIILQDGKEKWERTTRWNLSHKYNIPMRDIRHTVLGGSNEHVPMDSQSILSIIVRNDSIVVQRPTLSTIITSRALVVIVPAGLLPANRNFIDQLRLETKQQQQPQPQQQTLDSDDRNSNNTTTTTNNNNKPLALELRVLELFLKQACQEIEEIMTKLSQSYNGLYTLISTSVKQHGVGNHSKDLMKKIHTLKHEINIVRTRILPLTGNIHDILEDDACVAEMCISLRDQTLQLELEQQQQQQQQQQHQQQQSEHTTNLIFQKQQIRSNEMLPVTSIPSSSSSIHRSHSANFDALAFTNFNSSSNNNTGNDGKPNIATTTMTKNPGGSFSNKSAVTNNTPIAIEGSVDWAVTEMEDMLEFYESHIHAFMQTFSRLERGVIDCEAVFNMQLDIMRNELIRVEMVLTIGTFAAATCSVIAGIFGMNLKSHLEEYHYTFFVVTGGILLLALFVFSSMFVYTRKRGLL